MFRCEITGKMTKPGDKCNKIAVKRRERVYTHFEFQDGREVEVEEGRGWEIVKEINASDEGYEIWKQRQAA